MSTADQLRSYSVRWGNDVALVQGAGGNSSLKRDGRLLVKASGFNLADALHKDIFADLALDTGVAVADAATRLRPSIETNLHALMPHAVVAHLHMVDVLAYAVREDGAAMLAPLLAGLDWRWLPYLKPGIPLADGVAALARDGCPDIIVLGNHGIVFGGADFAAVDRLIEAVRARLAVTPRHTPIGLGAIRKLADRHGLDLPNDPHTHQIALDSASMAIATAGSLYPDHVVFLGRGVGIWPKRDAAMILVPGVGVLMARGLSASAHGMAACLAAVATRVASGACLRVLSASEEDELIDWDAEAYRRAIAAAPQGMHA